MNSIRLIGEGKLYEMQLYRGEKPLDKDAVTFSGALRMHYNPNMLWLLTHPLEANSIIYEFRVDDVLHVAEEASVTHPTGAIVEQVRLWVRRGSTAMRMEPMRVE